MKHIVFKVYPHRKSKDYFEVCIHRDKKAMHKAYRERCKTDGYGCVRLNFEALAGYRDYRRNGRMSKRRGFVLFHLKQISAGIVAHEMTHAAFFWLWNDRRARPSNNNTEKLATAVGYMVRQFYRVYWKAKSERALAAVARS